MDRRDILRTGLLLGASGVLAACASTPGPMTQAPMATNTPAFGANSLLKNNNRILLAYFSRPGENYFYGDRTNLTVGNTQVVADLIAAMITVDVYRIEAAEPYPDDYEQTVARNVQEERDNARPGIANTLPEIANYDTILLGCPVWNVQTPMIMRTFVEDLDFTGKTIHPFVTYAVSGMGRVRDDYTELLPDTTIAEGLAVQGEEANQAGPDVKEWLKQLELLQP